MKIPFQAGDPVTGEKFSDRKELLSELYTNIVSLEKGTRQDFAIISYRRMGKSSLLLVLKEKIEKRFACIYIDCSKLYPSELINFLMRYSKELYSAYSKKLSWKILPEKIASAVEGAATAVLDLIQKVGVGIEDIKVWLEFREKRISKQELLDKILNLPEKLASRTKLPCVVMLDEFQELAKFGKDFFKFFRAIITSHKSVDYIIAGSAVSMMQQITKSRSSPFYNLFVTKGVGILPEKETRAFLEKQFKGIKYEKKAINKIIQLSMCHPFYVQWLARAVFIANIDRKRFSAEDVENAYYSALQEPLGHFEYEIAKIKEKGRYMSILTIMAKYGASTPSKIAEKLDVKAGEVSPYLKRLVEMDFLEKQNGNYEFVDRIMKEWIKRRYG